MSFDLETKKSEHESHFADRYKVIEARNAESFYLINPHRSFDAYQSIHSIGDERINLKTLGEFDPTPAVHRVLAGGNMSTVGPYGPIELSEEARIEDAKENMKVFFDSIGIPETSVYMLHPERDYTTPLTLVDVDAQDTSEAEGWPLRLSEAGDFLYTRDPNKVLAVRPADCPVMIASADTPEGKIYMMVHYAWKGAANHYVEQTASLFESLGVSRESLEIYLTPGAQAENYPYTNYSKNPLEEFPGTEGLFTDVTSTTKEDGSVAWDFRIDTPKFVYDQVLLHTGVDPKQVFCDTSDTGALNSGYSSHSRSTELKNQGESNTRDIVTAVFSK